MLFLLGVMVVYDRIYLGTYINKEYICLKTNTTQLYLILGRANLHWNFSSLFRDDTDIQSFPTGDMFSTHFVLEYLWISEPTFGILEKFQPWLTYPIMKYNCALIFWDKCSPYLCILPNIFSCTSIRCSCAVCSGGLKSYANYSVWC